MYLRDVYDHLVHLLKPVDAAAQLIAGMVDYAPHINQMNRQMRFWPVIATLFMPLTLISSIYGMNFGLHAGLRWKWGLFYLCWA